MVYRPGVLVSCFDSSVNSYDNQKNGNEKSIFLDFGVSMILLSAVWWKAGLFKDQVDYNTEVKLF